MANDKSNANLGFENTGKTEIDDICIVSTSPKTISIIDLKSRDFLINYKTLSYEARSYKRFIKPGETVSIKVCYLKDKVIGSPVGAVASIYMEDINGNLWHQPLFCPTDAMENSPRASHKEFKDSRDIRLAFKCFKNSHLW